MRLPAAIQSAFCQTLQQARLDFHQGELVAAFTQLERAHILGQGALGAHLRVHGWMLRVAITRRDAREIRGQLWRLLLTPLGHLSGRLPIGNTGGANVSAFAAMPIPADLQAILHGARGIPARQPSTGQSPLPKTRNERGNT
ncbi:DUF3703 domain-containing protein [Chitinimonas naiadis]